MPKGGISPTRRPASRDRRGRGLRGRLAGAHLPLTRTRAQIFDDLVLDAVEELEQHWAAEVGDIEFAVEDVPPESPGTDFDPALVADHGIPLGRLYRDGPAEAPSPLIVLYRRPLETRGRDVEERRDIVFAVVSELVAEFLGKDPA